jgi:hypothetical protein
MPVRKALDVAIQIARGLAAAHDRGIVHRDLKPENVFVTSSGHVKILDFGLVKLMESAPSGPSFADQATAAPATSPGVVLGTVGYMAPEQVVGRPADHRADIFALGAVLYELLSGTRAFARDTGLETMNAILKEEPRSLTPDSGDVPPALHRIVTRCLEKNPSARFHSAGDLAFALETLTQSSGTAPLPTPVAAARPRLAGVLRWVAIPVSLLLGSRKRVGPGAATGSRYSRHALRSVRTRRLAHQSEWRPAPDCAVAGRSDPGRQRHQRKGRDGALRARVRHARRTPRTGHRRCRELFLVAGRQEPGVLCRHAAQARRGRRRPGHGDL